MKSHTCHDQAHAGSDCGECQACHHSVVPGMGCDSPLTDGGHGCHEQCDASAACQACHNDHEVCARSSGVEMCLHDCQMTSCHGPHEGLVAMIDDCAKCM